MTDDAVLLARLEAIEQKLDALSALARVVDQLGPGGIQRLGAAVDAVGTFAERLPVIADAAGSTVDWAIDQAERRGIDPLGTGADAGELLLEAARAENVALAKRLLAQRRSLETALQGLESIDPEDLRTVATSGPALTRTLAVLLRSPQLSRLLEATSNPATLSTAEAATTALVDVRAQPPEPVGLFAALRRMGDPDVQRAVGFTLGLAKRFGQLLGRAS
jgi:hypothetical protein